MAETLKKAAPDSGIQWHSDYVAPPLPSSMMVKLIAAAAMAMLPMLLYVCALFVLVAYWIKFTTRFVWTLPTAQPPVLIGACLGLLVFAGVIVFLSRPLWPMKSRVDKEVLDSQSQPELYQWSNALARHFTEDAVKEVSVTMDVAVDAYFSSFRALIRKELKLDIGLPLVALLTRKEIAALASHELVKYRETLPRVCYFLVRACCQRYAYLAQHGDGWYPCLSGESSKNKMSGIFRPFAQFIARLVYGVDQSFAAILSTVDALVLPTMQGYALQADNAALHVTGKEGFEALLRQLARTDRAYQATLSQFYDSGRAPENFVANTTDYFRKHTSNISQLVELAPPETFNSWHFLPGLSRRKKSLGQHDAEVALNHEGAASALVRGFDDLSERLSQRFYQRHQLVNEEENSAQELNPIPEFQLTEERRDLDTFSSGLFRSDIVWDIPDVEKFARLPHEKMVAFLNKVVLGIRQKMPDLTRFVQGYDEYRKQRCEYHYWQWMIKDGSRERPAKDDMEKLTVSIKGFDKKLAPFQLEYRKAYGVRVAAGVVLGRESTAYPKSRRLLGFLHQLAQLQDSVADTVIKAHTLEKLLERREARDRVHDDTIGRFARMILKQIGQLESVLGKMPAALLEGQVDLSEGRLEMEATRANGREMEVIRRFRELLAYFEAFNVAISAKLGRFVTMVERTRKIESVAVRARA